jgi:succinate-semialdehyde dehydrogenase/glutarate-semialdehyde dehydrogenase
LINQAWIDGSFVNSDKTFQVYDPASGGLVGSCPELTPTEVELAINTANRAFASFRTTTGRSRASILRQWHVQILQHADDLATIITWESGKALCDARAEVTYAASYVEWFAEEASRIYGVVIPSSHPGKRIHTIRQPVGVCALITPWNFPAAMVTRKIAPALASGCTVVLKAAAETPFTANALVQLAHRAGVPSGLLNVVTAMDNTVAIGELLSTHKMVKKLSFTGSTAVGKLLTLQSATTLKKLSMELGGNSPFIVFDDCKSLADATTAAIAAKFRGSGQTCVAVNRLFVQAGVYDQFVEQFTAKLNGLQVGGGFESGCEIGPVISPQSVERMEARVQDAIAKGAVLETGGTRLPHLGENFFQPTVLSKMTQHMGLFREEIFGPVACIYPFSTEEEVIAHANDTEVGLAGYLFSSDIDRIHRVTDALEVGMIGVNTGIISDAAAPFGGVKESGFGREGSMLGIEDYTIVKSVTIGS